MLNTFLIAIREGLEASLIVGILLAYVAKIGESNARRTARTAVWSGITFALLLSLGFGAFLSFTSHELSPKGESLFAGVTSICAVSLVTWMVFWMKKTARNIGRELNSKMDAAVAIGSLGLISTAFLSVAREGLETSLFLYASFKQVGSNAAPALGLILGLTASITLGALMYRRSLRINLGKFFSYTGIALIAVAASVLHNGLLDLKSFGALPESLTLNWALVIAYLALALTPLVKPLLSPKSSTPARA